MSGAHVTRVHAATVVGHGAAVADVVADCIRARGFLLTVNANATIGAILLFGEHANKGSVQT